MNEKQKCSVEYFCYLLTGDPVFAYLSSTKMDALNFVKQLARFPVCPRIRDSGVNPPRLTPES